MAKKTADSKVQVTISIDQTIYADYMEMLEFINNECKIRKCHPVKTLDEILEDNMKAGLRIHHVNRALAKYSTEDE